MDSRDFKTMFGDVAKESGFESAFGGWWKESSETIVVLDLQKSNFNNLYYLNIKIYVQGISGKRYTRSKNLVKKDVGDIFRRQPPAYSSVLDIDPAENDSMRKDKLEKMFLEFLVPFADKALSKSGIVELAEKAEIYLPPAVKAWLSQQNDGTV
ncbi:DUF4304 domain-containing protein [Chryseolinea soli]|uniref:DUF4304 domain-containing protein n=1 Tax=Chryseolinea soli TaxID=2321403 RepID=UPI001E4A39BD|nr:DUF4304 domain-containing protein [Chryseolinea soli]